MSADHRFALFTKLFLSRSGAEIEAIEKPDLSGRAGTKIPLGHIAGVVIAAALSLAILPDQAHAGSSREVTISSGRVTIIENGRTIIDTAKQEASGNDRGRVTIIENNRTIVDTAKPDTSKKHQGQARKGSGKKGSPEVFGEGNHVSGSSGAIIGNGNTSIGSESVIIGDDNVVVSNKIVRGDTTEVIIDDNDDDLDQRLERWRERDNRFKP